MPVDIHGKQYFTVAERVAQFKDALTDGAILTELVSADDSRVVMKAQLLDGNNMVMATGYAEEERGSSNINRTSALENAETSAVGRALAFAGFAGTEIASADEVANAIKQQYEKDLFAQWATYTQTVEEHHESLAFIRQAMLNEEWEAAREAWNELDHDVQRILWRAPTKGGWFTTKERDQMKHFQELIDGRYQ